MVPTFFAVAAEIPKADRKMNQTRKMSNELART